MRMFALNIFYGPRLSLSRTYVDYIVDTSRFFSLAELPEDLKARAAMLLENFESRDWEKYSKGDATRINP